MNDKELKLEDVVYYESIKREIKTEPIYECRCDERLKSRVEDKVSYRSVSGLTGTGSSR